MSDMNAAVTAMLPAEAKLAAFNAKLVPTVDPARVLGVRMGAMRKVAAEVDESFLEAVPHPFHELNIVHMLMLNRITDPQLWSARITQFLPHIDNWMVTDALAPKVPAEILIEHAELWLGSSQPYVQRLGIVALLSQLRKSDYVQHVRHRELVSSLRSEDYYVNMAQGWYLATYFESRPDEVVSLLQQGALSAVVHRMTCQKIIESRRTSEQARAEIKQLRAARR